MICQSYICIINQLRFRMLMHSLLRKAVLLSQLEFMSSEKRLNFKISPKQCFKLFFSHMWSPPIKHHLVLLFKEIRGFVASDMREVKQLLKCSDSVYYAFSVMYGSVFMERALMSWKVNNINHVINITMKYFIYHFCSKYLEMLGSPFTIIAITTFL